MALDFAASGDELRRKLLALGIAQANELTVAEGFAYETHDAGVILTGTHDPQGVGFYTRDIPIDTVHRIVAELAARKGLRRQPPEQANRGLHTLTRYIQ